MNRKLSIVKKKLKAKGLEVKGITYGDIKKKSQKEIEQALNAVLQLVVKGKFILMKPLNDSHGGRK